MAFMFTCIFSKNAPDPGLQAIRTIRIEKYMGGIRFKMIAFVRIRPGVIQCAQFAFYLIDGLLRKPHNFLLTRAIFMPPKKTEFNTHAETFIIGNNEIRYELKVAPRYLYKIRDCCLLPAFC